MHGIYVDQARLAEQAPILRAAVQEELRSRLRLESKPFLARARGPFAYRSYPMWIHKADGDVTLAGLIEMHSANRLDFDSSPRLLTPDEIENLPHRY